MKISHETLISQAETIGFRPDMLERVELLLQLFDTIRGYPLLKDKLGLKGGTVLNLNILNLSYKYALPMDGILAYFQKDST